MRGLRAVLQLSSLYASFKSSVCCILPGDGAQQVYSPNYSVGSISSRNPTQSTRFKRYGVNSSTRWRDRQPFCPCHCRCWMLLFLLLSYMYGCSACLFGALKPQVTTISMSLQINHSTLPPAPHPPPPLPPGFDFHDYKGEETAAADYHAAERSSHQ